jgi:hypothetical protein
MTAATTAFDTFLENIRLTQELREACQVARDDLQRKLLADATLSPIFVSMFLQGSYARHTGTKPNGADTHVDVDLVVVTNLIASPDGPWTPAAVLELFRPFLDREYPNSPEHPKHWEPNDRSIKISPIGSPVTLDLVVAAAPSKGQQTFFKSFRETGLPDLQIEARGDRDSQSITFNEAIERVTKAFGEGWKHEPLQIPSRDLRIWIPTHPLEQIRWTTDKNRSTDGHYVNVVKAIKWWRKQNPQGDYPKAYPLEHFIGDLCPDGITSVAQGVTRVLMAIRDTQQPWQHVRGVPRLFDRGVPQNDVFRRITPEQYRTFHDLASLAATAADAAFNAETNNESVSRWHDLFGPEFPAPQAPLTPPTGPAKATTSGRYG